MEGVGGCEKGAGRPAFLLPPLTTSQCMLPEYTTRERVKVGNAGFHIGFHIGFPAVFEQPGARSLA